LADKYDLVKRAYVDWRLTPASHRSPSSKVKFAEEHGVHRKTLDGWDKQDWFVKAMRESRDHLAAQHWSDIMNRLRDIVDTGSNTEATSAARVMLQHLDFKEDRHVKTEVDETSLEKILEAAGIKFVKE
jgi:hypothetical protein